MQKEVYSVRADRDIEEGKRRKLGEFYTPLPWVDEAYKVIEKTLGTKWKEDYIVWDCSCGTGNLTLDKGIKNLYNSTLISEDFEISDVGGAAFQYDFLNDDVEIFEHAKQQMLGGFGYNKEIIRGTKLYKVAPGLIEALENKKPILFLINPPYKAVNNLKTRVNGQEVTIKGGTSTQVQKLMNQDQPYLGSGQLYAQFMYRINILKELYRGEFNIALYSKQRIITAEMMRNLREKMYRNFTVSETFSFQASHFSGCSGAWAVLFSMWVDKKHELPKDTVTILKDIKNKEVIDIGEQELYSLEPTESLQEWIMEGMQEIETTKDAIYLSNGFKEYHKESGNGRAIENFLGGYFSKSNVVEKNSNFVVITSELMGDGSSKNITEKNFDRIISSFAARKLITGRHANWKVDALEYMKPNINHEGYEEWLKDSLILSIFHNDSYQTSIRRIKYNGKEWNIKNEFFFMSVEEIEKMAEKYTLKRVITDIVDDRVERYVYKRIKEIEEQEGFSREAQELLDLCRTLVRETFKGREDADKELHLENWDAGWMQIKKNISKEQYKGYYAKLKELEDKMRPMVRKLGFLR